MNVLSRLHCSTCYLSFPVEHCLNRSFDRITSCIICEDMQQRRGSIFLDSHQCPNCNGPAAYVIAAHDELRDIQAISRWAKGRTAAEFRQALSQLWWWRETKTNMEFILNSLQVFGDEANMIPAVEEWFHQAGEQVLQPYTEKTDQANRASMGFHPFEPLQFDSDSDQ